MRTRATSASSSRRTAPARTDDPPPTFPVSSHWTFLTNHAHVLVLLSRHPAIVLREVALQVGITERAVQRIIQELEQGGFIIREKVGRQNYYQVKAHKHLRHPIEEHCLVQELLDLIAGRKPSKR